MITQQDSKLPLNFSPSHYHARDMPRAGWAEGLLTWDEQWGAGWGKTWRFRWVAGRRWEIRPISAAMKRCQCQGSAVAKTPLCEQLVLGQSLLCCGEGQKHFCRGRKVKAVIDCVNSLFLEGKLRGSPNGTKPTSSKQWEGGTDLCCAAGQSGEEP